MAVVINMGDWRNGGPVSENKSRLLNELEAPFLKMEMHRAMMNRADHPGQSNAGVLDVLLIWAALYGAVSVYWLVKYILS